MSKPEVDPQPRRFKLTHQHMLDFVTGAVILFAICGGLGIGMGVQTV